MVVDCADYYDGQKTQIIGQALKKILDEVGIKDIPECYSQEFIDKELEKL